MKKIEAKVKGIDALVEHGVKVNKRTITVPKSNWNLIMEIMKRLTIEVGERI